MTRQCLSIRGGLCTALAHRIAINEACDIRNKVARPPNGSRWALQSAVWKVTGPDLPKRGWVLLCSFIDRSRAQCPVHTSLADPY